MNAPIQLTFGINPAHHNQYLFSDHYLDNLLPYDPRWDAALPEAEAFLAWLQRLYAQEQEQLPKYNENQLEEHWFKNILRQLGHVFEGQASVPGLNDGVKRPDYIFFPDEATRQAAAGAQKTKEYAADALAVGEVKRWDVPLSRKQKSGGASFEAQNPSWQIDYYLRATGLKWGILSNGRLWRLVHKDTSQRLSIHYEVDLVDLLSRGDAGAMRYFTLFFRQAALRPDAQGRVFLPDALAASMAYAVALEEDLETNVYQALERLMQGFLDLPTNGLCADDLRQIYENSLYLLYRLLFILYGETRGLLPMNRDPYRDNYSLDLIKREIAELKTPPVPMTTIYWGRLKQLFRIINGDNVELNRRLRVPRYNGRLFSPELHPFLEKHAVGDRALTDAIDLLSRRTTEAGREFVDYRTLGVRHLGSIYEGLLEYQPRYATEAMVAIRDNKGERWVGEADLERPLGSGKTPRVVDRREAGQVYLETDRGERKATGSYYTPQYIVAYIVENTLGPLVEEATERVRERAKEAKAGVARAAAEQSLIDEILNLKVLDPAMGSGHFLVEATDYLALALATDPYVETEVSVEEDLTHWKRRVVERCIYGVDKNPLAVELAKLSLWLATVAADKPLSFLDHHLQCGDSLIGARVADLGWAPPAVLSKKAQKQLEQQKAGQMNMFEYRLGQQLPIVMGRILEITEVESDSYETVRAKEAADRAVRELKVPFQAVANLWVSAYFGNEFTQGEYDEALGLIGQPIKLLVLSAVERAQGMMRRQEFFHWELTFPEVFYDRNGQPLREAAGFDAVAGNPPYGAEFDEEKSYLSGYQVSKGKFESYTFFMELGLRLVREHGMFSLIVPSYWLITTHAEPLREVLLTNSNILELDTLTEDVFPNVRMDTMIFALRKQSPAQPRIPTRVSVLGANASPLDFVAQRFLLSYEADQSVWHYSDNMTINVRVGPDERRILSRIEANLVCLGDLTEISQGLTLYRRSTLAKRYGKRRAEEIIENRLFHANYQKDNTFKKELGGDEVSRYEVDWRGSWVSYGDWLAHKVNEKFFINPRIVVQKLRNPRLERRLVAAYLDDQITYSAGVLLNVISAHKKEYGLRYILALMNSALLNYWYCVRITDVSIRVIDLKNLPIRRIEFTTPPEERRRLVEDVVERYYAYLEHGEDVSMRAFVAALLMEEPEQADVVHDLLAHLTGQMVAMNKQKQAAVEAFWLDLEGVTEAAAFDILRNKGKHERTLWKKAEACRPFVREESHSTRRLNEGLGWNEEAFKAFVKTLVGRVQGLSDLVGVYRAHSPAYRELVGRIEATDWLIDQIVYKLYGLTEEEIAIVEGKRV